MHLFPLHYIKQTNGRFLIEDFSLAKVHGCMQLIQLLTCQPEKIKKILTVTTSSAGDEDRIVREFNVVRNILKQNKNSFDVEPTVKDVLQAIGPKQLIRFATHGFFPKQNLNNQDTDLNMEYTDPEKENPYFSCGLLLCFNNHKPVLNVGSKYYKTNNLLPPKILIDSELNLKDTHISIQACVSGHSKEGIGGDALGLEWAFFSSGVASLISANWNIEAGISNKFFIKFYHYWLDQKLSKSQAYRLTVLDLMKNDAGEFLNMFEWGGLTLSGDFR